MSASLVGSEMCIRDSFCHVFTLRARLPRTVHVSVTAPHSGVKHGSMAVSYTHLTLPTICSV
eukprot:14969560-Alexandrium_andersonii.AAC.1